MSLGETRPLGIGFGKGWKGSRAKSDRRAAQIRALWHVCTDGSLLAKDCVVALGLGSSDDDMTMVIDRIVDAINTRVAARNKET